MIFPYKSSILGNFGVPPFMEAPIYGWQTTPYTSGVDARSENCAVFLPIAPTEILKIGATKLNTNPSLRPPERLVVVRDNVLWTDGTSSFCWTSVVQRCHSQNFSHNTIVFATLPEKYREHAQWKAYWYLYLDPSDPSVWHTYGGFLK